MDKVRLKEREVPKATKNELVTITDDLSDLSVTHLTQS